MTTEVQTAPIAPVNPLADGFYLNGSLDRRQQSLMRWAADAGLHEFLPDFHRLQIERWIWEHRDRLTGTVLDIGVESPRRWLGDGYGTFGLPGSGCDQEGDLLDLPLPDDSLDGVLCTEVLEHCTDPFRAMRELHRVLRPGGLLLVTSPFLWPWHGTDRYQDYWRFTHEGWRLLLRDFGDVKILECRWTHEGETFLEYVRRFECWGYREDVRMSTGYLASGVK